MAAASLDAADDLLLDQLGLQSRIVKPNQKLSLLDPGTFGNDLKNVDSRRAASSNLATNFDVAGTLDLATLQYRVDERPQESSRGQKLDVRFIVKEPLQCRADTANEKVRDDANQQHQRNHDDDSGFQ